MQWDKEAMRHNNCDCVSGDAMHDDGEAIKRSSNSVVLCGMREASQPDRRVPHSRDSPCLMPFEAPSNST